MKRLTKKMIRSNRRWQHFLSHCAFDKNPPMINLKPVQDYNPEQWRSAFERYQSSGHKALTTEERINIEPLLAGQKAKEILLTTLAIESMEYWAKGMGWILPWLHTLMAGTDRLTQVAILRTIRNIRGGKNTYNPNSVMDFFLRHPGIPRHMKDYYMELRVDTLSHEKCG